MSGGIKKVIKIGRKLDPLRKVAGKVGEAIGIDLHDPMGLALEPEAMPSTEAVTAEAEAGQQEQIKKDTAAAARAAKKQKKKPVTQTVLTSPLGATETAATAITKLGGV